jgi:hypothetical protein
MLDMCTGILVRDIDLQTPAVENQVVSPTSLVSPELAQPLDVPATGARDEDVDLRTKFRKYVAKEESWLDRNLKEARYDLDSVDSVHLILGSGPRIEKVRLSLSRVKRLTDIALQLLIPLLYLLLQHHFEILCIARSQVCRILS